MSETASSYFLDSMAETVRNRSFSAISTLPGLQYCTASDTNLLRRQAPSLLEAVLKRQQ